MALVTIIAHLSAGRTKCSLKSGEIAVKLRLPALGKSREMA